MLLNVLMLISVLSFGLGVFYSAWKLKFLPATVSALPLLMVIIFNTVFLP